MIINGKPAGKKMIIKLKNHKNLKTIQEYYKKLINSYNKIFNFIKMIIKTKDNYNQISFILAKTMIK